MSTISAASSARSDWSATSRTRGKEDSGQRLDKLFAKVDSNGDGSVDATELQGMLDKMSQRSGGKISGDAADLLKKMDADGDGKLSKSELGDGLKSLMAPPASTMAFAQAHGGGGHGGPPPGGGGSPPAGSGGASSSDGSSAATDPLDTNGDGVVSPMERAIGQVKDALQNLLKTAETADSSSTASRISVAA